MKAQEFLAMLDEKNPYYDDVRSSFEESIKSGEIMVGRKGRDLVRFVQNLIHIDRCPVVDKRLSLVFGCKAHLFYRAELFRYHYYGANPDGEYIDPRECADRYVQEGYGYYISSMRVNTIVLAPDYRPDRFDKDLFMIFDIDYQDFDLQKNLY